MLCPFCGRNESEMVFYQESPLYLSALRKEKANLNKTYPFSVYLCRYCGLGFNGSPAPQEKLKEIYDNYVYIDPFKNIGNSPFDYIVNIIKKHSNKNDKIVEIGSSVGFLLRRLKDCGYRDLLGIDPSPQADVAVSKGLNVRKSYYGADDFGKEIDLFVLRHVFEHFANPFEIFKNMISQLKPKGKIIVETPNFDGFYHQHLFFYSLFFYINLAKAYDLKIIDYETYNDAIIVVFSNCGTSIKNTGGTTAQLAQTARFKRDRLDKNVKKLKEFLRKYDTVYCWGTGAFSVILLSELSSEDLRDTVIYPLDSDISRKGLYLPNITQPVLNVQDIKDSKPQALAILSSLTQEIKNVMKTYHITPLNTLELD
ncbi:MAG: class I SAM-dependent methyltransferase [Helicobacteraceae bacterium]|jgi:2-polyprenyl-3-methyl-5-hydroxy-6-metoxy-1,4-benzoquinol methylase|nr:class I SAM-dependent methyltransferase [Helicobacteraceae bacterium]